MKFTFDNNKHLYRLGSRRLPSVTQGIQNVFGKREWYSEWHAQRGTAVHLAIHYLVNGVLDWNTVDERILGRVKAFEKFLNETGYKVEASEIRLYSRIYQFAGTIDLILSDNKKRFIADIKSSIEPIVEIQLGGYAILWNENNPKQRIGSGFAVKLKDDGNYVLDIHPNLKLSEQLFKAVLTVSNFKEKHYGGGTE